jgi:chromosome partitioning protein
VGQTIACANQKGGVGKTTTVINLGSYLALAGERVLVLDLDPQGNATSGLGCDRQRLDRSVYDAVIDAVDLEGLMVETVVPGLCLIPSSIALAGAEVELAPLEQRERRLARLLEPVRASFDYILIDCPPSLGLLTTNALTAATHVLIPIQSDYLAMRGTTLLLKTIGRIQRKLNPRLKVWRILITMHNVRTVHAKEVLEEIRSTFKDVVFTTPIKYSVRAKEAPVEGQSILTYDPASEVAQAYRSLAQELISHG